VNQVIQDHKKIGNITINVTLSSTVIGGNLIHAMIESIVEDIMMQDNTAMTIEDERPEDPDQEIEAVVKP